MTPTGLRRLLAALPGQLATRLAPSLDRGAEAAADEVRQRLAAGLDRSGPGQPDPTGRLAASVTAGHDPETGAALVTVAAPFAADLEYGTTRMAARPFLRPAVEAVAPAIRDDLAAALDAAVAEALRAP